MQTKQKTQSIKPLQIGGAFLCAKFVHLTYHNDNRMIEIAQDNNGQPIYEGDVVIDSDGHKHTIAYGKRREIHGFGYVYGYYIPDYCIKPIDHD